MPSTDRGQSWKPGDPIPARTFTLDDMRRAQDSEVRLVTEGKVLVPDSGTFVVRDGEIKEVALDIVTPGVAYAYADWSDDD